VNDDLLITRTSITTTIIIIITHLQREISIEIEINTTTNPPKVRVLEASVDREAGRLIIVLIYLLLPIKIIRHKNRLIPAVSSLHLEITLR